jgi:CDP-diglyceride synthetase
MGGSKMNDINRGMNEITPEAKASLKSRVIVAGILIAILVPSFIIGSWVFFVVLGVFLAIAIHEMIRAPHKKYPWYVYVITYLIVFSFVYWFIIKDNFAEYVAADPRSEYVFKLESYFSTLDVSVVGIAVALGSYFFISLVNKDFTFSDVAYFIAISILLGLGFQSVFFLRYYPFYLYGYSDLYSGEVWFGFAGSQLQYQGVFEYLISCELIFFVFLDTILNDTFAYFIGSLWGKHHLNERVSPHKTWEGFFAGWIGGGVAGSAVGLLFAALGYPMLPTLTIDSWYWIVLLGFLIPLLGDLGDLSFSLIKRHFVIKDFGTILRGHGGVLDRVDSHLFASIGVSIILIFITNSWNFLV